MVDVLEGRARSVLSTSLHGQTLLQTDRRDEPRAVQQRWAGWRWYAGAFEYWSVVQFYSAYQQRSEWNHLTVATCMAFCSTPLRHATWHSDRQRLGSVDAVVTCRWWTDLDAGSSVHSDSIWLRRSTRRLVRFAASDNQPLLRFARLHRRQCINYLHHRPLHLLDTAVYIVRSGSVQTSVMRRWAEKSARLIRGKIFLRVRRWTTGFGRWTLMSASSRRWSENPASTTVTVRHRVIMQRLWATKCDVFPSRSVAVSTREMSACQVAASTAPGQLKSLQITSLKARPLKCRTRCRICRQQRRTWMMIVDNKWRPRLVDIDDELLIDWLIDWVQKSHNSTQGERTFEWIEDDTEDNDASELCTEHIHNAAHYHHRPSYQSACDAQH